MPYADASAQTTWAGLAKSDNIGPEMLLTAPDTTTPPAETITEKSQIFLDQQQRTTAAHNSLATSLLGRRKHRPDFPTRISLPKSGLEDEVMPSPPTTRQAPFSPLPEANKRYAGHTPLIPRALSPEPEEDEEGEQREPPKAAEVTQQQTTSEEEEQDHNNHNNINADLDDAALSGPLMLPTDPIDAAEDHIALDVLDSVLEQVAKDQDRFSRLKDAPEPTPVAPSAQAEDTTATATTTAAAVGGGGGDEELTLSRKESADSRQSSSTTTTTEFVDGVRLKSPPLNFGAPYGKLSFVSPPQA